MRYREQRLPCDTEVVATLGEEIHRIRFVNISATGARVEGLGPLPDGALVVIQHLGDRHAARAVWSNQGQAGLRWARPLSPAELSQLRGTGGVRGNPWAAPGAQRFRELT